MGIKERFRTPLMMVDGNATYDGGAGPGTNASSGEAVPNPPLESSIPILAIN